MRSGNHGLLWHVKRTKSVMRNVLFARGFAGIPNFGSKVILRVPQVRHWIWRRAFQAWGDLDEKRRHFYEEFVTPGCLVFDIGANLGNRAKIFLALGARVVAFEPQTDCARFLRHMLYGEKRFFLEQVALGDAEGTATMKICDASPLSSLSEEWILATRRSGRFSRYRWKRKEAVEVRRLDAFFDKYGMPDFVKIDVEGSEYGVLSGLSALPPAMSFEYTPEMIDSALNCIRYLDRLGQCEYQVSRGESMEMALADWISGEELKERIGGIFGAQFGDVYVRRVDAVGTLDAR